MDDGATGDASLTDQAKVPADDVLTSADIDAIVNELGGLATILEDADPPDKIRVYQALDLRLRYQPDEQLVVATADLAVEFVVSEGCVSSGHVQGV